MLGRGGFIAATILLIVFGVLADVAPVRASSTVAGPYYDTKVLSAELVKASDALDQIAIDLPDDVSVRDVLLLALNIYYEARGEGVSGKAAVAHVTLNRMKDGRWPGTLTGVIFQPGQFSWTRKPGKIEDPEALKASVMVAAKALMGTLRDRTGGALYFHGARLGDPDWTQGLTRVAQIGAHTFYAD